MKISTFSSPLTFGATAVMTCKIKDLQTGKRQSSTLFKLDTENAWDNKALQYSKYGAAIQKSFDKAYRIGNKSYKEFYVLQNDKTGEIISCASTTHRYRNPLDTNPGLCTVIEEFGTNDKYVNSGEPMLTYIIKKAWDRFDKTIYDISASHQITGYTKRARFCKSATEDITFLPRRRFNLYMDAAELRSQINYEV